MKAMDVYKMGVGTTQFLHPGIHHLHIFFNAACDMLCNSIGNLIGGSQHDPIQALLHGQLFPFCQSQMGASIFNTVHRIGGKGDHIA